MCEYEGERHLQTAHTGLSRERCVNEDAPPAQGWQHPLPPRTEPLPDFSLVKEDVVALVRGDPGAGGQLARLAWQCAATFRATDYLGGCNGARIR